MSDSDATGAGAVGQESPASDSQQEAPSQEYVTKADLEEIVGRIKQSQGDILTDRVEKEGVSLEARILDRVKPHLKDVDFDKIQEQAELDEIRDRTFRPGEGVAESPQAEATSQASESSPLDEEIDRILETHGVERDDPQIKEYLGGKEGTLTELLVGLDDTAAKVKASQPGASTVMSPGGKPATPDLIQDYVNEMAANRGRGASVRRDIKNKYRNLGVEVDKIGFGAVGRKQVEGDGPEELTSAEYIYES